MSGFLSSLTFATPLALAALLALPAIWWLLRSTPPRPATVKFPPLRLLLELASREQEPDRTPWWLLLLRLALAALLIIGVSHPAVDPNRPVTGHAAPLLLVIDDSWAAAETWERRQQVIRERLEDAREHGQVVTLATTTPSSGPRIGEPTDARQAEALAAAIVPKALSPDRAGLLLPLQSQFAKAPALHVLWVSDGLDQAGASTFLNGLQALAAGKASIEVVLPARDQLPLAMAAPALDGGRIKVTALRVPETAERRARVIATAANGRSLGEAELTFAPSTGKATAAIELPTELRNEVARISLDGSANAAAAYLLDDRWRRRTIAMMAGTDTEGNLPLLAPLYYVSRALEPFGELSEAPDTKSLKDRIGAGLSMLVLADVGVIQPDAREAITSWVRNGGLLVRFAGPKLAGLEAMDDNDPLLPVKLRLGGRSLSSTLSWETPQALQPFADNSPFAGLAIDPIIRVNRQILAEPDIDLPQRTWAALEDGTPLVTARREGKGTVVLFHVTASADWSNLPATGLFVEMLRKLIGAEPAATGTGISGLEDNAQAFVLQRALTGTGELADPPPDSRPVSAKEIDAAKATPEHPAGLYVRGSQQRAINIAQTGDGLSAITELPAGVVAASLVPRPKLPLAPYLFGAAALLFLLDCLAALMLGGGLHRRRTQAAAILLLGLMVIHPGDGRTQSADDFALANALETRLAYVLTGDAEIDRISDEGLKGLSAMLRDRTSIEPADPAAVDIAKDEIAFFPLLYWPVKPDAVMPSDATLAKIDAYMKNGGTIFFDLRDDGTSVDSLLGGATAASDALRRILAKLDIPPLEPVPAEHVLTKSFYLLSDFPGRYDAGRLWVERSEAGDAASGAADGVSTLIIGSNDYAAAWAMDDIGNPLYATIPGGDRQREMAFRSGINIVMYAMTGNYKADQVHIPALLERLGQ